MPHRFSPHRLTVHIALILLLLAAARGGASANEQLAPGVVGELYVASPSPGQAAVIILHGRAGIDPSWRDFARSLKEAGISSLVLHYAHATGLPSSRQDMARHWDAWLERVSNAVTFMRTDARVAATKVALVGFSLGGFLAVNAGGINAEVTAVVEYYGGATRKLSEYVATLPPVLILHGGADSRVPVARAHTLQKAMEAAGKSVEMKTYPLVGHCFDCAHWNQHYDSDAKDDARTRTMQFLRRHLE